MKKRIIDKRIKEKYMIDDEYLNGQARLCGWQGTIAYNSLCRHVNKSQEAFPSLDLMAEQHGVSRPTIIKGLNRLERNNVINIIKTKNSKGQWVNNTYILIDKSEWIYNKPIKNKRGKHLKNTQVNKIDKGYPSKQESIPVSIRIQNQVNKIDTKETHLRKHIDLAKETFAEDKKTENQEFDSFLIENLKEGTKASTNKIEIIEKEKKEKKSRKKKKEKKEEISVEERQRRTNLRIEELKMFDIVRGNISANRRTDDGKTISSSARDVNFDFKEKMKSMENNKSQIIRIIGLYFYTSGQHFENAEQYSSAIRRNLRAAKDLKGYSFKQIFDSMMYCNKNSDNGKKYKWKLETVNKFINVI